MEGDFLVGRGASLGEIAIGLVLTAVLGGIIALSAGKSIDLARSAHARRDMSAILFAARQYAALHGSWPRTWAELRDVLPQLETKDPWGGAYRMGVFGEHLWVEADISREGRERMFTGRMPGASARLIYEKRNVHEKP